MKKIILIAILACLEANAQNDQNPAIDSLLAVAATAKKDTTKVNAFNAIAYEYIPMDIEKSNAYAEKSLALAIKINYKKGEADAYNAFGKIHHENYNQKEAIEYYKKAIAIYRTLTDKEKLAKLFYRLGNVHNDMNSYASALESYFSATKIYEQTGDTESAAIVYCQISTIYRGLDDFEKSEKYLDLSTKLLSKSPNTKLLIYNYISYAQLYDRKNDIEKVEYYARKTYELAVIHGDQNSMGVSQFALGVAQKKKGKFTEAIAYSNKALSIFNEIGNFMGAANAYNELGICYFEIYKKTKDRSYLALSKENYGVSNRLYTEGNLIDGLADNYLALSKINEIEGNYKQGLENFKQYALYNDSILSASNKETIRNLEDKRTIALRDKELQLGRLENATKEKQKWYLIGGIIMLFTIGILLFFQNRNRRKTNKKLQLLNAELDQANKIKSQFFSILNHDLRSPVANLIHFLHLQKEHPDLIDGDHKIRLENKTINAAENLLDSMEDILEWSKSQMENFKPHPKSFQINSLFDDIRNHFSSAEQVKITFENNEDLRITTDENYLKTIMRNLTGNAIKASENSERPTIHWKVWKENGQLLLSVADNGNGASKEELKALYDDKEVVGIKTGLGLHLIRDLAKAINCEITVHSKAAEGTTFLLAFGGVC